jgi:hypothetical protein
MWTFVTSLKGSFALGLCYCGRIVPTPSPLEPVLTDIEKCLAAGLWHAALALTLSLPDICSVLEMPPDKKRAGKDRYAAWFDKNMSRYSTSLTGMDCYRIRCGVLHRGEFGHPQSRFDRVIFTLPANVRMERSTIHYTGGVLNALQLDLVWFCQAMTKAVRAWVERERDNPNVVANMESVIRFRPRGIPQVCEIPSIA